MYFDPMYFVFMIPGLLLTLWSQHKVNSTFKKYSQVANSAGVTGAQASQAVMQGGGVHGVQIVPIPGELTDHYDPRKKVLALSKPVYDVRSIAAMAVGAHESGHAIQDATGYGPLKFRSAIVPAVSIGSSLGMILLIAGIVIGLTGLSWVGVGLFALTTLFALVTLPVEFNASARAKAQLRAAGLVSVEEADAVDKVLDAAAWTYVAGFATSILQLLYYVSLVSGNSSDRR